MLSYQQIDTPQPFHQLTCNHTSRLSSNHHHLTARTSADTSPAAACPGVSRRQTAATVEHLPSLQSVFFRATTINIFKVLFRTTRIFQKELMSYCSKKKEKASFYVVTVRRVRTHTCTCEQLLRRNYKAQRHAVFFKR